MLLKADILLLDEPTNHLDPMNRNWVENYLTSQTQVSMIMCSHDAGFLERVCTNMLHIDNLKVKHYPGSLQHFVAKVPEAKAFFELKSSDKYKFKFPEPGNLEGITSKVKDKSLDNAELKDAHGNDVTIQTKKVPTKQEMKKLKKSIAKRRKEGEEVWTDEEMEKMGYVMDVA